MGRSVNIYWYQWNTLINALKAIGITDEAKLIKCLELGGIHAGDKYYLLSNEYWEDESPDSVLADVLGDLFPSAQYEDYEAGHESIFEVLLKENNYIEFLDREDLLEKVNS